MYLYFEFDTGRAEGLPVIGVLPVFVPRFNMESRTTL